MLQLDVFRLDNLAMQEQDAEDEEGAAFGRMLASHNQNVQHRARPLDDAADSIAGEASAAIHCALACSAVQQHKYA